MSGQNNNLALFSLFDYFPGFSAGSWVHARGRLVQKYELGVAQEGNCELEFALLTTRDQSSKCSLLWCQIKLLKSFVDNSVHILDILEPAVEKQVLSNCHTCEKYVILRTQTDKICNVLIVCEQINPISSSSKVVDDCAASCWLC